MSRVRIVAFGPNEDKNDTIEEMNDFLGKPQIKYVNHTFSLVHNQESVSLNDEQLFAGSIAYYVKEDEGEKKKD